MKFNLKSARETLCGSCKEAKIIKFKRGTLQVYCEEFCKVIKGDVEECTAYLPHNQMSIHEMHSACWVLEVKKGEVIGFKAPKRPGGEEV